MLVVRAYKLSKEWVQFFFIFFFFFLFFSRGNTSLIHRVTKFEKFTIIMVDNFSHFRFESFELPELPYNIMATETIVANFKATPSKYGLYMYKVSALTLHIFIIF